MKGGEIQFNLSSLRWLLHAGLSLSLFLSLCSLLWCHSLPHSDDPWRAIAASSDSKAYYGGWRLPALLLYRAVHLYVLSPHVSIQNAAASAVCDSILYTE